MTTVSAFRVTGPPVAEYLAAAVAVGEWKRAAFEALAALTVGTEREYGLHGRGARDTRAVVVGLSPPSGVTYRERLDYAPPGWRWTESRDCYRPVQGKAGNAAREWLAEVNRTSPEPPLNVLAKATGLPAMHWGGHAVYWPGIDVIGTREEPEGLMVTYSGKVPTRAKGEPKPEGIDSEGFRRESYEVEPTVEVLTLSAYWAWREAQPEPIPDAGDE